MKVRRGLAHIIYTWLVIAAGICFLGSFLPHLNLDQGREMLILLALGIVAEWVAVTFPQGRLSVGFAVVFFAFIVYGTPAAAWVSGLATLIGQGIINRGNPLRTTLFNAAMYVICVTCAAQLYFWAGGKAVGVTYNNYTPLFIFTCTYFLINNLLVYNYQSPTRQRYPLLTWGDTLQWDGITYLLSAPFGVLMALLYKNTGISGILLFFIPVLMMQLVLRLYVNLALANRELTSLYEVARRLGGQVPLEEILDLILVQARRTIPYHTGVVYLLSGDRKQFLPSAVNSPYAEQIRRLPLEKGEGPIGQLALAGIPKIITEKQGGFNLKSQQGWVQMQRSLLVIPLMADGEAVGIIALGDKRRQTFDEGNLQLMMIMGGQVKAAITQSLLHKKLEAVAVTDGLTKVYNRRYFFLRAQAEYERALSQGLNLILIIIDIDNFKPLNDRRGHLIGDAILAQLGQLLREEVAASGLVGRYGGQEFAVLLSDLSEETGHLSADKLRRAVRAHRFTLEEGRTTTITVSMGLAVFPRDGGDFSELVKKAERALRRAKEGGKDKLVRYSQLKRLKDV